MDLPRHRQPPRQPARHPVLPDFGHRGWVRRRARMRAHASTSRPPGSPAMAVRLDTRVGEHRNGLRPCTPVGWLPADRQARAPGKDPEPGVHRAWVPPPSTRLRPGSSRTVRPRRSHVLLQPASRVQAGSSAETGAGLACRDVTRRHGYLVPAARPRLHHKARAVPGVTCLGSAASAYLAQCLPGAVLTWRSACLAQCLPGAVLAWRSAYRPSAYLALAAVRYRSMTSPARAGWSPSGPVTQSAPLSLS